MVLRWWWLGKRIPDRYNRLSSSDYIIAWSFVSFIRISIQFSFCLSRLLFDTIICWKQNKTLITNNKMENRIFCLDSIKKNWAFEFFFPGNIICRKHRQSRKRERERNDFKILNQILIRYCYCVLCLPFWSSLAIIFFHCFSQVNLSAKNSILSFFSIKISLKQIKIFLILFIFFCFCCLFCFSSS